MDDLEPLLVIAPRHMSLVPQIEELCRLRGLTFTTVGAEGARTSGAGKPRVLIIGQMGKLLEIYAVSEISIVGGTFKPLGGHNPLEPASQGTAIIVGPHIHNIADDIEYLRSEGAACITDEAGLAGLLERLARDAAGRRKMADCAVHAVKHRKGIAAECVRIMADEALLP
jgi:3-deoxy-D-manno-octulosonic-acid transferase